MVASRRVVACLLCVVGAVVASTFTDEDFDGEDACPGPDCLPGCYGDMTTCVGDSYFPAANCMNWTSCGLYPPNPPNWIQNANHSCVCPVGMSGTQCQIVEPDVGA